MANYNFITETGTIIPDTVTILIEVQDEYKAVFGSNLITNPGTTGGRLIELNSLERIGIAANNAQLANQINPNLAGGVYLDAILSLMGSERTATTFSTVANVDLAGQPATVIPSGSQAQNSVTGTFWELVSLETLDGSGMATGTFQALDPGEISCNPSELTIVASGVLGWETVNNTESATLGSDTQSDPEARNFRRVTLAGQGSSLAEAMISALVKTPGVVSQSFRENIEDTTEIIDGVTMVPKSVFACVDGGTDIAVANALVSKKSGGCAYNGTTIVPLVIPFSGQLMNIQFQRPDLIGIFVRVTANSTGAVQDPATVIRTAIIEYADGLLSGEEGFIVGADASPFELSGAINQKEPTIFVSNVEISTDGITYVNSTITIEIFEKAFTNEGIIQVILT